MLEQAVLQDQGQRPSPSPSPPQDSLEEWRQCALRESVPGPAVTHLLPPPLLRRRAHSLSSPFPLGCASPGHNGTPACHNGGTCFAAYRVPSAFRSSERIAELHLRTLGPL